MGGFAFDNVSPVTERDLKWILEDLLQRLQTYGCTASTNVGSTGKVPVTADVDLAVEFPESRDVLLERMRVHFGPKNIRKFGSNTISVLVKDDFSMKNFQVDIMIGKISYLTWARFSDPNRSAVKGVVRNLFLNSWNRFNAVEVLNERNRYAIDWERGLTRQIQTKVGKNGKPLKEWKTTHSWMVTDDPAEIMKLVLNVDNVCWTFEDVVNAIGPRPVVDAFFPVFLKELEVLLEQTPHLLGANPHKSLEEIRTVLEKLSSWTPR